MALKPMKYKVQVDTPAPNTGKILAAYIKANRIRQNALARKLTRNSKTLREFKKRPSIQTAVLWEICLALNYNFFKDLAAQLPASLPPLSPLEQQQAARIAELEKENELLKHDLQLLKEWGKEGVRV